MLSISSISAPAFGILPEAIEEGFFENADLFFRYKKLDCWELTLETDFEI